MKKIIEVRLNREKVGRVGEKQVAWIKEEDRIVEKTQKYFPIESVTEVKTINTFCFYKDNGALLHEQRDCAGIEIIYG